jgi:hypothetical protein
MKTPFLALAILLPLTAFAAGPLTDGAQVRVASSSIEPGWFTGKARIDERGCWMVHLDKATKDRYTLLALMVVNRLEVAASGSPSQSWTPIDVRAVINAQPKECLEEGAD